jgi:hypothetical protein
MEYVNTNYDEFKHKFIEPSNSHQNQLFKLVWRNHRQIVNKNLIHLNFQTLYNGFLCI